MLRRTEPLEVLSAAAAGCDRLVLLGDVIELRHGPLRGAFAAARPVLEQLGDAVGAGTEVVLVAGNHDHRLLREWLGRAAADGPPPALGLEAAVDWREGEPLHTVAAWLAPARVRAAYPGVWLREDVYAMHGHYSDLNTTVPILERLGAGLMTRLSARRNGRPTSAEDYEAALAPMYDWIDAVAEHGGLAAAARGSVQVRAWRGLQVPGPLRLRAHAVGLGFRTLVFALNQAGIGPLRPDLSGAELRRAGLRAAGEVVSDLAIEARHVLFGHTHRAGPLPGDAQAEWLAPRGTRLLNTGSWVHMRGFLGDDPARSPYRPGFAVVLEDEGPPELVNLLDPA